MDLSKILAISGKNGLFSIVSQSKAGLIVESLADGKKSPVFATDRSSVLEDISVFTYGEDMPLKDILLRIFDKEEGKPSIDHKAKPEELKLYFESIVPEYDKDRVYVSDIKKIINWYNILIENNLISKADDPSEEAELKTTEGEERQEKTLKKVPPPGNVKQSASGKMPSKLNTPKRKTHQKK
jgi:hypothetical protein